ncbi:MULTISPECIES: heavy metal sensor histidine kinase [Cupriavidus]|jgi:two-component system heavy metal sensor histidine kinase CusS|uniref:heavy metal sensor histidine kinase n=1 Tax=Cupriavidus TaxID=106589 RepID=UPI00049312D6|nr:MULTISPECIES: heavy metal sensor histidine kinase [Cupriavidus]KWW32671.1 Sensor kinase CusS [Cupriavidus metallidurans]MCA3194518.1 heavy metal sensor histidine kinase [Cupriavidus sp.]MDE4921839.1 heavy metal sensor histidine kinase [Cupriavidus metallidurans]
MRQRLSLTVRLTILFSLSSAVVLLGLGVLIWLAMERHFANEDFVVLGDNIRLIERVANETPVDHLPARLRELVEHHRGFVARVQTAQGKTLFATRDFDFRPAESVTNEELISEGTFVWQQEAKHYRGMRAEVPVLGAGTLKVVVGMDTEIHAHFMHAFRRSLAFYTMLAAFASGLLGWWAARRGLAPLRMMASRAKDVTANRLDARMPVAAVPVEMADLAATLNAMLERLQNDFQRLSEFSSDLAHELRTPITNLMTQTHVVLAQPRDAAKYRDVLTSNAEEFQRLGRMVSDMLYLAKMEHGITLPNEESIDIADEVQALFDFYDALAEDKGVNLQLHGNARITGDRLMVRRALSNLLSNALRYTAEGRQIMVSVREQGTTAMIVVENEGEEIRPDLLPYIFDRFYRADKSRARLDSDSVGLGLSITKAIVVAHGGNIAASSSDGRTRFTMTFPHGRIGLT